MSIIAAGGAHRGSVRDFYSITIDQSLRFNSGDGAYLSRTTGSATSTYTFSTWLKRGDIPAADYQYIFSSSNAGLAIFKTGVTDVDEIYVYNGTSEQSTDIKIRDPSSWYHIVFSVNSGTAAVYLNGVAIKTGLSAASLSTSSGVTRVGRYGSGNLYFDGYLAETHLVTGSALTASSFGETKSDIWVAKKYTGSHGDDGFKLTYADSSAFGDDTSGEGHDLTSNNFDTTDQVLDTPTNNFCVLNPLEAHYVTLNDGNLSLTEAGGSAFRSVRATFMMPTGKWFWEFKATTSNNGYFGGGVSKVSDSTASYVGNTAGGNGMLAFNGNLYNNDAVVGNITTAFGANVVIGVAFDADAGTLIYYKDGTSLGTAFTGLTSGDYFPAFSSRGETFAVNFGQQDFYGTDGSGTLPTGYLPLSTANLPDPVIDPSQGESPADYFNTVFYTGNGDPIGSGGKAVTGVGFQPDWTWIKNRDAADSHALYDIVRGVTKQIESDTVTNETTESEGLTAFGADGFTLGNLAQVNTDTENYVAWSWKANGSGVSNTDGTTTGAVTVSANQELGFSIVKYVGQHSTGGACTVGHGLNAVPSMIIAKQTSGGDNDWPVYHASEGAGKFCKLNGTPAFASDSTVWNNTTPTTSVFSVGSGNLANNNGQNYIAYVFSEVDGFSKFGTYDDAVIGSDYENTSPFVYTGFRPAFLMIKGTSSGREWVMYDNKRTPDNGVYLRANTPASEQTDATNHDISFNANGFKVRGGSGDINTTNESYIYMAFADQPFKYANGGTE